jgi:hypothetical protein
MDLPPRERPHQFVDRVFVTEYVGVVRPSGYHARQRSSSLLRIQLRIGEATLRELSE